MANYKIQVEPDYQIENYKLTVYAENQDNLVADITEALSSFNVKETAERQGGNPNNRRFSSSLGTLHLSDERNSLFGSKNAWRLYIDGPDKLVRVLERAFGKDPRFEILKPKNHSLIEMPEREGFFALFVLALIMAFVIYRRGADSAWSILLMALTYTAVFGVLIFGIRSMYQYANKRKFVDPIRVDTIFISLAFLSFIFMIFGGE